MTRRGFCGLIGAALLGRGVHAHGNVDAFTKFTTSLSSFIGCVRKWSGCDLAQGDDKAVVQLVLKDGRILDDMSILPFDFAKIRNVVVKTEPIFAATAQGFRDIVTRFDELHVHETRDLFEAMAKGGRVLPPILTPAQLTLNPPPPPLKYEHFRITRTGPGLIVLINLKTKR